MLTSFFLLLIVFMAAWLLCGLLVFAYIAWWNAKYREQWWAGLDGSVDDKLTVFLATLFLWPMVMYFRWRD